MMLKRPGRDWENIEDMIEKWSVRIGWGIVAIFALYLVGHLVWFLSK